MDGDLIFKAIIKYGKPVRTNKTFYIEKSGGESHDARKVASPLLRFENDLGTARRRGACRDNRGARAGHCLSAPELPSAMKFSR